MRLLPLLIATAALLGAAAPSFSQDLVDDGSSGVLYVIAFPDTTKNTFDARYPNNRYEDKCFISIYSAVDNKISIRGSGYQRTGITLTGGRFTVIDLMGSDQRAPAPIATETCRPTRGGVFRIDAERPIIVYQYMVTKFGTEAWTPIPVEAWGREYYAAAMPGEVGIDVSPGPSLDYNRRSKMFPAVITIVAAYDDTHVTIEPEGAVMTDTCALTEVVLNAGDAYQVQSYVDTGRAEITGQADFGGTRITATDPIGVITGNTRALLIEPGVGLAKNSFRNSQIEALAPVEYFGHEFVYLPTMDAQREEDLIGDTLRGRRPGEFVRLYLPKDSTSSVTRTDGSGTTPLTMIDSNRTFLDFRPLVTRPAVYRSTAPAQAMVHTPAAVTTAPWTPTGAIGWESWAGYMVSLAPRTQWVSRAPLYVSTHPAGMSNYLNVVTDSAHRYDVRLNDSAFVFNHGLIPNSDLVWGTVTLQGGREYVLSGLNGARFHGFAYGTLTRGGYEEFRPHMVRPADSLAPAGIAGEHPTLMHPAEYEEYLAIAYAYPLVSRHLLQGEPDSLVLTTTTDCGSLTIRAVVVSGTAGLRAVRLDGAVNTKIVSVAPNPILGASSATIEIRPINRMQDASATVLLTDRTGKVWPMPFRYSFERVEFDPSAALDFGLMTPDRPVTKQAKVTNPLHTNLTVRSVRLVKGDQGFRILSPTTFPIDMPRDSSSFLVDVEGRFSAPDRTYRDTLLVLTSCDSFRLPLVAETADPCVSVDDLDFGILRAGESKTLPLSVCNDGGGVVTFDAPFVSFLVANFTVSPEDLDRLRATVLRRGECVSIKVTFNATNVGTIRDVARFWASVRKCRDTSVWTARVVPVNAAPGESTSPLLQLHPAQPNPFGASTEIAFEVGRYANARLAVTDALGREVAELWSGLTAAGEHRVTLADDNLPAGVYTITLTSNGERLSRRVVLMRE